MQPTSEDLQYRWHKNIMLTEELFKQLMTHSRVRHDIGSPGSTPLIFNAYSEL